MARNKKADVPALTQAALRAKLTYDPDTGFFWRHKKVGCADLSKPAGAQHNGGYICVRVCGVRYLAHRLAWFWAYDQWPEAQIDHVNGIRNDNRIANLREATNAENCRHGGLPRNNTSGFRGVTRFRNGWKAQIKHNMNHINIGVYATPEEAHAAYCETAKTLHEGFWSPGARPSHRRKQIG